MVDEEVDAGADNPVAAQKQQCIFCHIVSGKVASKKVYEDDLVIAILDINPANPGHLLIMPKEHYSILPQLPQDALNRLAEVAKKLSHAALRSLHVEGTTVFAANGLVAGQRAAHVMLHVIPRVEGDGLPLDPPTMNFSEEYGADVRKKILPVVSRLFRIAAPQEMPMQSTKSQEPAAAPPERKQPSKADLDVVSKLLTGGKT